MAGEISFGGALHATTGASSAYESIGGAGELKSFTSPTLTVSDVPCDGIDQSSSVMQTLAGMRDGGVGEAEFYYNLTTYAKVLGLDGVSHSFRYIKGTKHYTWTGYINSVGGLVNNGPNEPITYKVSFKSLTEASVGTVS